MTMYRALLFLYAETPLHVGADASIGALDLPIQREVGTGLPIIKAESLKGALRERFRPTDDTAAPGRLRAERERWLRIFGAEPPVPGAAGGTLPAGTLRVHEAQLLAFPAPTLVGTFAWVTSPLARARLERKLHLSGISMPAEPDPDVSPAEDSGAAGEADQEGAAASDPSGQTCLTAGNAEGRFVLGPYSVIVKRDQSLRHWASCLGQLALPRLPELEYFKDKMAGDLFACSDELCSAITRDCAPVAARVQLGTGEAGGAPRKTVQNGPFYSEYLPAEALLVALLECDYCPDLDHVCEGLDNKVLRVGGDETLGKGLLWCRVQRPGVPTGGGQKAESAVAPEAVQ